MINFKSSGIHHYPQNLQNSNYKLSPLINNKYSTSTTIITDTPSTIACPLLDSQNSDENMNEMNNSQLNCSYHYYQSALKESKTAETQTSLTSQIIMPAQMNSQMQSENIRKQINFDFNSLHLKNPTISIRSRLLNNESEEEHDEEENRHLSDIELLRQVYDELRYKISQT
ncbi:hypothetical protein QQG55_36080 [Brugia pahangi]|uniref:Uncharacterized protein n=1 Tax=Brugia pahangi TaxID=6280 RepID=A0A0N4TQJ9_BRUPA|nr:unnamed protein product [Brugia pahangi]